MTVSQLSEIHHAGKRFEDRFLYEIGNSSKLSFYNCIKKLQQNDTLVNLTIINIDQLLQNLEFQCTPSQQRKEDGDLYKYLVVIDTVHFA